MAPSDGGGRSHGLAEVDQGEGFDAGVFELDGLDGRLADALGLGLAESSTSVGLNLFAREGRRLRAEVINSNGVNPARQASVTMTRALGRSAWRFASHWLGGGAGKPPTPTGKGAESCGCDLVGGAEVDATVCGRGFTGGDGSGVELVEGCA